MSELSVLFNIYADSKFCLFCHKMDNRLLQINDFVFWRLLSQTKTARHIFSQLTLSQQLAILVTVLAFLQLVPQTYIFTSSAGFSSLLLLVLWTGSDCKCNAKCGTWGISFLCWSLEMNLAETDLWINYHQVTQNAGKFLANSPATFFSGRNVLHGVTSSYYHKSWFHPFTVVHFKRK